MLLMCIGMLTKMSPKSFDGSALRSHCNEIVQTFCVQRKGDKHGNDFRFMLLIEEFVRIFSTVFAAVRRAYATFVRHSSICVRFYFIWQESVPNVINYVSPICNNCSTRDFSLNDNCVLIANVDQDSLFFCTYRCMCFSPSHQ